jgi:signal transduction histidine kinase
MVALTNTSPAVLAPLWLRVGQAVLLTAIGFLFAQLLTYDYRRALPEARIDVNALQFTRGEAGSPPEQDYGHSLDLPYNWREDGHPDSDKEVGTGWYTAVIDLNVPPNRLWVVYFPNITSNSTIYLNNEILGRGKKLGERLGQMRQRPLYLNIPNGILHSGENLLQIRVQSGRAFHGSIESFYLGPEQAFKDVYARQYFYQVTLVKVIGVMLFFSAVGNGVIWFLRREETLNGWFALGCLLWSLHIVSNFHAKSTTLLGYLEFLFRYQSITWFTALLVVIVNRYQQIQAPRQERVIFTLATSICVILPLVPTLYLHVISNLLVGAFALSMIAFAYFTVLLNNTRHRSLTDFFIATSIAIIFFLSVNDLMATLNFHERKYSGMSAHYGAPFLVILLSWKLIRDFVRARDDAEELNRTLEARVEEKANELERNYTRLREMEAKNLLAEERDRIVMDMHDGLGGQLVSALSMLDREKIDPAQVSETLRDALTDLRMMIDALDPVCDDLAMVLGSFRATLEKNLAGSNMKLIWKVEDVPATEDMNPHKVLQILRILQEAINNAVKYSQATELTVSTGTDEGKIYLQVADNGTGITCESQHGRGLSNMRRRADMINASLHITSANGVSLRLIL